MRPNKWGKTGLCRLWPSTEARLQVCKMVQEYELSRIVQGIWQCLQNLAAINTHGCRSCRSWRSGRSPPRRNSALPRKVRRGANFKIQNSKTRYPPCTHKRLIHLHFLWANIMRFFKISTKTSPWNAETCICKFEFWISRATDFPR